MAGVAAVIVAAGKGSRVGGDLPKQFRPIGGESILRRTLTMFAEHGEVAHVQPVIRPEDADIYREQTLRLEILPPVFGGATRQASVRAGLEALEPRRPDIVLVHDAARPFASAALVSRAIAAAKRSGAAIPALPVTDTVKTVDAAGQVGQTLDRNSFAAGADTAKLRLPRYCLTPIAARPPRAARISPTMPRSPNGLA